jgi:alkanesulfonate monooxygenase SsuD/methylene tetrahydromethanopterin reductase-like flavin-dependent oxidoreductase (luciferase family)
MEFGIFVQGHVPARRQQREGQQAEHNALMGEVDLIQRADRTGWKYAWVTEHHFLTEYSHLSASDVYLGYCAALTERIHLGSGIFSFNPAKDHPARIAERVAMLDHMSEGRFEFGTGRGAGTREVTGFDIESTDATRAVWDEVIREIPKMWRDEEYAYDGTSFRIPHPAPGIPTRDILPKPWKKPHPPMWVAAGNPPTFEKAARLGLGVLAFTTRSIGEMAPLIQTYKDAVGSAEPVGGFVNDNVMITSGLVCMEDGKEARRVACDMGLSYLQSQVFHYHDTIPTPEGAVVWPDHFPEPTPDDIEWRIENGYLMCGDPDEVATQVKAAADAGIDQLVFGLPCDMPWEVAQQSVELFGEHVIPKYDLDPVHSTDRYRESAA